MNRDPAYEKEDILNSLGALLHELGRKIEKYIIAKE